VFLEIFSICAILALKIALNSYLLIFGEFEVRRPWLSPVILATQEAEIRRIVV
jgi:hypothetical protein